MKATTEIKKRLQKECRQHFNKSLTSIKQEIKASGVFKYGNWDYKDFKASNGSFRVFYNSNPNFANASGKGEGVGFYAALKVYPGTGGYENVKL